MRCVASWNQAHEQRWKTRSTEMRRGKIANVVEVRDEPCRQKCRKAEFEKNSEDGSPEYRCSDRSPGIRDDRPIAERTFGGR